MSMKFYPRSTSHMKFYDNLKWMYSFYHKKYEQCIRNTDMQTCVFLVYCSLISWICCSSNFTRWVSFLTMLFSRECSPSSSSLSFVAYKSKQVIIYFTKIVASEQIKGIMIGKAQLCQDCKRTDECTTKKSYHVI